MEKIPKDERITNFWYTCNIIKLNEKLYKYAIFVSIDK